MGRRNNSQRKENVESPRKEISETEACNMTEKEFRVMVVEFIHRMNEKINNLCKNQEEMKSDIATIREFITTKPAMQEMLKGILHLHHMELRNLTEFSEFLLLGLSEKPELQSLIFGLFLSMYLITVLGNLLITLAISSDSHLHTPMYFFLSNLSLVDICFTSTTIPKMLWNIQTLTKAITYGGCITQMCFFVLFVVLDNSLLTVMAYDRYVAICHPLHYMVIMNPRLCGLLVLIVVSICRIPSAQGKYKAFSTCASHLLVVSLFYGTSLGVYLSSAVTQSSHSSATASVMYTVLTPMLNPFIYSLRNKDIKRALKRFLGIAFMKGPIVLGLKKCT
ncbi:hypothetical protein QTO34_015361 [Cnephaeus nilssonii]|uniref:Olfactory receptor n=1 Tax=Cnephaeus nilssonii TaxID=3371016 RepID=A0AA40I403_CNENI|nr:hypothetical protein QTO34_015361 [Eptesicus nilssonii]